MATVQGYDLGQLIHTGTDTCVYRAKRSLDGLSVVIKMPREDALGSRTRSRLRHDQTVLEHLKDCPGVVRIVELVTNGLGMALVMEDAGPEALDRVLDRGMLPMDTALRLTCALAEVLVGVHRAGVLHRDIKPGNVVADPAAGSVTLLDFGIASRLSQQSVAASPPETLEGTLAYIAPEQTGRMSRAVDTRADLYSVGVVLYELLAGRRPFADSDPLSLVHSHIARMPTPLHELNPDIPQALSDIVFKLLAKTPEDRYQSASGLIMDLREALRQLAERRTITPFPLGTKDLPNRLHIPQKLYGREQETATLNELFEQARQGKTALVLVAGPSGVGKSALVHELYKGIARTGQGQLLSGKYDQICRAIPYAGISRAFGDLATQWLASSEKKLAAWRKDLQALAGPNGHILTEFIPELRWVLGAQQPLTDVGPAEAQNRFDMLMRDFVVMVARARSPLVLFLDDLQWADEGSFKWMQSILTDPEQKGVLLIGAYRDNELGPEHSLFRLIAAVRKAGRAVSSLQVGPLRALDLDALLADTFKAKPDEIAELGKLVLSKTGGNPFYVGQFLEMLHGQGMLERDTSTGVWSWDLPRIQSAPMTDNVVDLMVSKVRALPEETQRALGYAACAGFRFALSTLSLLQQSPREATARRLWPALSSGLAVPLDGEYRLALASSEGDEAIEARYQFLHDRVQEAAYATISGDERARAHLDIGRRLRAAFSKDSPVQDLFDLVRHLNLGVDALSEAGEREDLVRLNLDAGRRATNTNAFSVAVTFLRQASELLGDTAWDTHHELKFATERLLAECQMLSENVAEAEHRFRDLLDHTVSDLEWGDIQQLRITLYGATGSFAEAAKIGIETLARLKVQLPTDPAQLGPELGKQFGALMKLLTSGPLARLATLAPASEPLAILRQSVLARLFAPAAAFSPQLGPLTAIHGMRCALEDGPTASTARCLANFALVALNLKHPHIAKPLARLALMLSARTSAEGHVAGTRFFAALVTGYEDDARTMINDLDVACQLARQSGDVFFEERAGYMACTYEYLWTPLTDTWLGRIASLRSAIVRRGGGLPVLSVLGLLDESARRLQSAEEPLAEQPDLITSQPLVFVPTQLPLALGYCWVLGAISRYLAGDIVGAIEAGEKSLTLRRAMYECLVVTDAVLIAALALAERIPQLEGSAKDEAKARLAQHAAEYQAWSDGSPTNTLHRKLLLDAEVARLEGRDLEAMALYERSIAEARVHSWVRDEAIANELCGRFHLAAGRRTAARAYLEEACGAYARWGAPAKVRHLQQRHAELLSLSSRPLGQVHTLSLTSTAMLNTSVSTSVQLDVDTAIRAAQAIAGELNLGPLLGQMMRLCLQNAGAQRGLLLLGPSDALRVEAAMTVTPEQVFVLKEVPAEQAEQQPRSLLQYVVRTSTPIVLSDAHLDPKFADDPYLKTHTPHSVLALPLIHQGRTVGVLYLEHRDSAEVFTPSRVALLTVVASQTAIAVENVRLYSELRAANEDLEAQVAARTAELRQALSAIWSEMDLATKIQTVLLPPNGTYAGYELAAKMKPADTVGGDYYDLFEHCGHLWVLVGDVSGHGVSAGLVMMMVQTAVRSVVEALDSREAPLSPARMLSEVNAAVWNNLERIDKGMFMTLTALRIDGPTVRHAGLHLDMLVYRSETARVDRVETTGVWVGLMKNIKDVSEDLELTLSPGDCLILHTDGLTESRDSSDELLDLDRVGQRVAQLAGQSADGPALVDGLFDLLTDRTVKDDVTIVTLRRNRGQ